MLTKRYMENLEIVRRLAFDKQDFNKLTSLRDSGACRTCANIRKFTRHSDVSSGDKGEKRMLVRAFAPRRCDKD